MAPPRLLLSLLLAAALAIPASADVLRLKNGGRLEGKILSQSEKEVVIETEVGRQTIPRADVESIEIGKTAREVYEERLAATDKGNLLELAELADFCRERSLRKELKDVYRMILRIDPDNEEAREGLSYVKVDGEWVLKARLREIEDARKKKEAEERSLAAKEKGGKAASAPSGGSIDGAIAENAGADRAEAEALKDFFGGTPPTVMSSRNFSIKGPVEPEKVHGLLDLAEKAYAELNAQFGLDPGKKIFLSSPGKRLHVLLVNDKATFADVLPWVEKNYSVKQEPAERKLSLEIGSLPPLPIDVAVLEGRSSLEGHVLHRLGETYLRSTVDKPQAWFSEGFAFFVSTTHLGRNTDYCVGLTEYGKGSIADKDLDTSYALLCEEMAKEGTNRPFRELMVRQVNQLDYQDLAQSWATVRYIVEGHPDTFRTFFRKYRGNDQEKTLKEAFGVTPEDFDAGWREWVLKSLEVKKPEAEKPGSKTKPDPKKKPEPKKPA